MIVTYRSQSYKDFGITSYPKIFNNYVCFDLSNPYHPTRADRGYANHFEKRPPAASRQRCAFKPLRTNAQAAPPLNLYQIGAHCFFCDTCGKCLFDPGGECCFTDPGGECCFTDPGGECCFTEPGGECCFTDPGGECCFTEPGGECCFTDPGGLCTDPGGVCCFTEPGGL